MRAYTSEGVTKNAIEFHERLATDNEDYCRFYTDLKRTEKSGVNMENSKLRIQSSGRKHSEWQFLMNSHFWILLNFLNPNRKFEMK